MPHTKMTNKTGKGLVILLLIGMFVQLGVITLVGVNARQARHNLAESEKDARLNLAKSEKNARLNLVHSQRRGCLRGKRDRQDNADFQRAQSRYIFKVTQAASVREDVKRAARIARRTFKRTSTSLTKRAKIDCKKAYP